MDDDNPDKLIECYADNKPYFGLQLFAEQSPQSTFDVFPTIVEIVRKTTGREYIRILEVGSWAGGSIIAWDKAANANCELTCIDHWQPYLKGSGFCAQTMGEAAKTGEIKRLFMHNIGVCGLLPRLRILEGPSEIKLQELSNEQFDLVFIDGNHSYSYISHDIKLAKPLIVDGGILCGDDLQKQFHEVVYKEVCRNACENDSSFIEDADGVGYHPGVTLAVYEAFGVVEHLDRLWFKQL